eukprot:6312303-Amphidinium_carterae.1
MVCPRPSKGCVLTKKSDFNRASPQLTQTTDPPNLVPCACCGGDVVGAVKARRRLSALSKSKEAGSKIPEQ